MNVDYRTKQFFQPGRKLVKECALPLKRKEKKNERQGGGGAGNPWREVMEGIQSMPYMEGLGKQVKESTYNEKT